LQRSILLNIEAKETYKPYLATDFGCKGNLSAIAYHFKLSVDGGYIEGHCDFDDTDEMYVFHLTSITIKGHDFLEAARNETAWTQSKAQVATIGSTVSLDIMKMILVNQVKSLLGLP
jgi:hypothetical protein